MPMVVFLPPKEREDAALMTPSSVLAKVPSGFLVLAMILPFSQTSPKALTAMRAATVIPFSVVSAQEPMPLLQQCSTPFSFPTVAPQPAP